MHFLFLFLRTCVICALGSILPIAFCIELFDFIPCHSVFQLNVKQSVRIKILYIFFFRRCLSYIFFFLFCFSEIKYFNARCIFISDVKKQKLALEIRWAFNINKEKGQKKKNNKICTKIHWGESKSLSKINKAKCSSAKRSGDPLYLWTFCKKYSLKRGAYNIFNDACRRASEFTH